MKRVRITLSFVINTKDFPALGSLNDGFEAAVRALWPGMECTIEPGGRFKMQQLQKTKGVRRGQ